jgi:hypothetical protein
MPRYNCGNIVVVVQANVQSFRFCCSLQIRQLQLRLQYAEFLDTFTNLQTRTVQLLNVVVRHTQHLKILKLFSYIYFKMFFGICFRMKHPIYCTWDFRLMTLIQHQSRARRHTQTMMPTARYFFSSPVSWSKQFCGFGRLHCHKDLYRWWLMVLSLGHAQAVADYGLGHINYTLHLNISTRDAAVKQTDGTYVSDFFNVCCCHNYLLNFEQTMLPCWNLWPMHTRNYLGWFNPNSRDAPNFCTNCALRKRLLPRNIRNWG